MSGAAAVIHGKEITNPALAKLQISLGSESNNYLAELRGINIGLKYVQEVAQPVKVLLLCDCKPALESSMSWATAKEYRHIVTDNRRRIQDLRERGAIIKAAWIPGHSDFGPNEEADALAKAAARRDGSVVYPCETTEVVNKLKEMVLTNWQNRVDSVMMNEKAQGVKVKRWFTPNIKNLHLLWQLASGHNKLNRFWSRIDPTQSPRCLCGKIEDADHFLFDCERYSRLRFDLLMEMNLICGTDKILLSEFGWTTILGQETSLAKESNHKILEAVTKFIGETKRF